MKRKWEFFIVLHDENKKKEELFDWTQVQVQGEVEELICVPHGADVLELLRQSIVICVKVRARKPCMLASCPDLLPSLSILFSFSFSLFGFSSIVLYSFFLLLSQLYIYFQLLSWDAPFFQGSQECLKPSRLESSKMLMKKLAYPKL